MARMNTALAANGAEFLVLGRLLIEGIETYKGSAHETEKIVRLA